VLPTFGVVIFLGYSRISLGGADLLKLIYRSLPSGNTSLVFKGSNFVIWTPIPRSSPGELPWLREIKTTSLPVVCALFVAMPRTVLLYVSHLSDPGALVDSEVICSFLYDLDR
jgi:hypothetical protein